MSSTRCRPTIWIREFYLTEIARRFALTTNSVGWHSTPRSRLSGMLIYKQGIINQGGPADIMLRRVLYEPVYTVSEDIDGDGTLDLVAEDIDGDGVLDIVEDLDGDGNLDVAEDLDGTVILDVARHRPRRRRMKEKTSTSTANWILLLRH